MSFLNYLSIFMACVSIGFAVWAVILTRKANALGREADRLAEEARAAAQAALVVLPWLYRRVDEWQRGISG